MEDLITQFTQSLVNEPCGLNVFNQYCLHSERKKNAANSIRRKNLELYLKQMAAINPSLLLVGEAPGYRGCRRTGVPFTSESILLHGVRWNINNGFDRSDVFTLFGTERGFQKPIDTLKVCQESTATILWQTLAGVWPPPLLWNAFPFHPHHSGKARSNRAPLVSELSSGTLFLASLVRMFQISQVIAVGLKAARALELAGIDGPVLRHPSHGGKQAFQQGLKRLCGITPLKI